MSVHTGRRWAGRSVAGSAALGLAALAVLATPAPAVTGPVGGAATAAVPGLQVVEGSSAFDSSTSKFAFANCPAGKVLLGTTGRTGGFFGDPSNQQVVLEGVVPVGTTGVIGQASEDEDGFAGNWSITVGAICANPVAGLQVVSTSGVSDSVSRKQKIAVCPTGKQLTGLGGAVISSTTGQVRLESFAALTSFGTVPTGANIIASEDETGVSGTWSVQSYAICADPLPGLQLVSAVSAAGSGARVLQSATCPTGKRAVGIGAFLTQSSGFGQVGLDTLLTSPAASVGPPTAHLAFASEDQTGFSGNWTLTAQAICANA
jgi:hypothetical protein